MFAMTLSMPQQKPNALLDYLDVEMSKTSNVELHRPGFVLEHSARVSFLQPTPILNCCLGVSSVTARGTAMLRQRAPWTTPEPLLVRNGSNDRTMPQTAIASIGYACDLK
jgi:hypothetical protein